MAHRPLLGASLRPTVYHGPRPAAHAWEPTNGPRPTVYLTGEPPYGPRPTTHARDTNGPRPTVYHTREPPYGPRTTPESQPTASGPRSTTPESQPTAGGPQTSESQPTAHGLRSTIPEIQLPTSGPQPTLSLRPTISDPGTMALGPWPTPGNQPTADDPRARTQGHPTTNGQVQLTPIVQSTTGGLPMGGSIVPPQTRIFPTGFSLCSQAAAASSAAHPGQLADPRLSGELQWGPRPPLFGPLQSGTPGLHLAYAADPSFEPQLVPARDFRADASGIPIETRFSSPTQYGDREGYYENDQGDFPAGPDRGNSGPFRAEDSQPEGTPARRSRSSHRGRRKQRRSSSSSSSSSSPSGSRRRKRKRQSSPGQDFSALIGVLRESSRSQTEAFHSLRDYLVQRDRTQEQRPAPSHPGPSGPLLPPHTPSPDQGSTHPVTEATSGQGTTPSSTGGTPSQETPRPATVTRPSQPTTQPATEERTLEGAKEDESPLTGTTIPKEAFERAVEVLRRHLGYETTAPESKKGARASKLRLNQPSTSATSKMPVDGECWQRFQDLEKQKRSAYPQSSTRSFALDNTDFEELFKVPDIPESALTQLRLAGRDKLATSKEAEWKAADSSSRVGLRFSSSLLLIAEVLSRSISRSGDQVPRADSDALISLLGPLSRLIYDQFARVSLKAVETRRKTVLGFLDWPTLVTKKLVDLPSLGDDLFGHKFEETLKAENKRHKESLEVDFSSRAADRHRCDQGAESNRPSRPHRDRQADTSSSRRQASPSASRQPRSSYQPRGSFQPRSNYQPGRDRQSRGGSRGFQRPQRGQPRGGKRPSFGRP